MSEYNHVGRPTNEEVKRKKRNKKMKIAIPIAIFVLIVLCLFLNGNLDGLMGNSFDYSHCKCEEGWTPDGDNMCYQEVKETSQVDAYILGDANGQDSLTYEDYTVMRADIFNGVELDDRKQVVYDTNKDGKVDLSTNEATNTDLEQLKAMFTSVDTVVRGTVVIGTGGSARSVVTNISTSVNKLNEDLVEYVCPKDRKEEETLEGGQKIITTTEYEQDKDKPTVCNVTTTVKSSKPAVCQKDQSEGQITGNTSTSTGTVVPINTNSIGTQTSRDLIGHIHITEISIPESDKTYNDSAKLSFNLGVEKKGMGSYYYLLRTYHKEDSSPNDQLNFISNCKLLSSDSLKNINLIMNSPERHFTVTVYSDKNCAKSKEVTKYTSQNYKANSSSIGIPTIVKTNKLAKNVFVKISQPSNKILKKDINYKIQFNYLIADGKRYWVKYTKYNGKNKTSNDVCYRIVNNLKRIESLENSDSKTYIRTQLFSDKECKRKIKTLDSSQFTFEN